MKTLIVYSSKTGNTRKVAEAIHAELPDAELADVKDSPDPSSYDFIFMGSWIDKGTADAGAQKFMEKLDGKRVAIFATLGAYPDSDHAKTSLDNIAALLPSCTVVDRWICQGAIDPKLIERMNKLPPEHAHAPDEARVKRWEDAKLHPNDRDFEKIRAWAKKVTE